MFLTSRFRINQFEPYPPPSNPFHICLFPPSNRFPMCNSPPPINHTYPHWNIPPPRNSCNRRPTRNPCFSLTLFHWLCLSFCLSVSLWECLSLGLLLCLSVCLSVISKQNEQFGHRMTSIETPSSTGAYLEKVFPSTALLHSFQVVKQFSRNSWNDPLSSNALRKSEIQISKKSNELDMI